MEFKKIVAGMSASYSQTITDSDVKSFSGISGDKNPIHMDEKYASVSRYKKRIVHGLLPCSFFSALFGTKLPGEGCVYASQSIKFLRPIYIGDTVTASVIVKSLDHQKHNIHFETICKVENKVVINGEACIFVPPTKKNLVN
jgi:3-hydroxybutyryl-CoA dehydratase